MTLDKIIRIYHLFRGGGDFILNKVRPAGERLWQLLEQDKLRQNGVWEADFRSNDTRDISADRLYQELSVGYWRSAAGFSGDDPMHRLLHSGIHWEDDVVSGPIISLAVQHHDIF